MRVKLIQITQSPIDVMWVAARTCYSSKSPVEMWDKIFDVYTDPDHVFSEEPEKQEAQHWNLVKKVLDSGHQSIAEHVYFTFAIEGVDRALTHQLVRHRHCTFSQQSQRYVEIKEDLQYLKDLYDQTKSEDDVERLEAAEKLYEIANKYFVLDDDIDYNNYLCNLMNYLEAIQNGCKPEEARSILPNATKTNITMSCNFRELIHICHLRLCTRAQSPIRNLFKELVKCVKKQDERLASYLVTQCDVLGLCTEKECCGRKPHINSLKEDILTKEEWKQIQESIDNPQINEKLQKLMGVKNVFN